jgi:hypothetical protein
MGDGSAGTSLLASDISGTAHWLALGADIFDVLVVFLPYRDYLVVIVIDYHFQDIFRACLYAFAAAVALIAVNDDVPVSRAIGVTIVSDIARHYQ